MDIIWRIRYPVKKIKTFDKLLDFLNETTYDI
jgi:hypothetical protein